MVSKASLRWHETAVVGAKRIVLHHSTPGSEGGDEPVEEDGLKEMAII